MRWLQVVTAVALAGLLRAEEPPLKGGSNAGKELAEVQKLLDAGKAAEGADKLRRLVEESGDDLVTLDGRHFRPLARVAQGLVLNLPANELRAWRARVDPPAKTLLDLGRVQRDPRPLRQLVERSLASSHAEDALVLLAELAAEHGDHRSAETHLRRLLPSTVATDDPSVPNVKTPAATVRARLALALIFQGHPGAKAEVAEVRAKFPTAAGRLAGRDGPFADTLEALLREPPSTIVPAAPNGDWGTLGGDAARGGQPAAAVPKFWRARPTWRADFPGEDGRLPTLPRVGSTRSVALHPVTLNGTGYVADGSRVFGFDPRTGDPRYAYDLATERDATPAERPTLPTRVDADFVLTAAGGRLFARLGATDVAPLPQADGRSVAASYLVCFGPPRDPGPRQSLLSVLWKLAPPVPERAAAAWEAAPVVDDGRLYAAFVKESAGGLVTAVACYAVGDATPERPLWVTTIADVRPLDKSEPRHRAEPLTLAGGLLTYCTHTGSVVALDAATGRTAWAFQYPRLAKPSAVARDVNPPVAHAGRVFVAPTDADRVLCLDAVSGKLLWSVEGLQIDQFLGVAAGKLVAAIAAPQRGLRGFDINTGADGDGLGWKIHDDPHLASWGRGLVTEDAVLWPTKSGVFFVRPADGLPLGPRLPGPHGNLAFADGVLLVGTPTGVLGYVNDPPPRPSGAAQFGAAERQDRAEDALRAGRTDDARRAWGDLLTDPGVPRDHQARAAARLLSLSPGATGPDALTAFHRLYPAAKPLAGETVLNVRGVPARLGNLVADHFQVAPPLAKPAPVPPLPLPPPFDAANLPGLDPGAKPAAVPWPSARCHPLVTADGDLATIPRPAGLPWLLAGDAGRVVALDAATGGVAASVPVTHGVTQADVVGGVVYLSGPDGISAVTLPDGRVAWALRFPDTDPLPAGRAAVAPHAAGGIAPGLSHVRVTAHHLVALWGDSHLVGVGRGTGEVEWVRPAGTSTALADPPGDGPRFAPAFTADDWAVVAHLSTGRRVIVRTLTGVVLNSTPAGATPWETPPQRLGDSRLAVPGDLGGVTLLELPATAEQAGTASRTLADLWTWEPGGVTSLTGRPTQLAPTPAGLLAAVSRNHGTEVQFLSRAGKSLRNRGMVLPTVAADLTRARHDGRTSYLPADGRLFAVRHADGKAAWPTVDLAALTNWPRDAPWRVVAGRQAVLAYPAFARPAEPLLPLAERLSTSLWPWPSASRLPGVAVALAQAALDCRLPLVWLDPDTGRVLATRDLAVAGPGVGVTAARNFVAVAAAGRAYLLNSP